MREIVLQPGTSIEIDGVVVRAAGPSVDVREDTACAQEIRLDDDSLASLRDAVSGWLSSGDLSQAHLLGAATKEAARVMSILLEAEHQPSDEASVPSSPLPTGGTPE